MSKTDAIFKGNDRLPGADSQHAYTVDELREFVRCQRDPVYFIRHYVKIISLDTGLTNFELYPFQEDMIRCYHENRFSITMASRQVGKSTTVVAFFLWYVLFNTNVRCCISANKQKISIDLLQRLKLAYEHLPRFLQQGVQVWAKMEIVLSNGSSVFAAATSSSAVRGGSYSALLLDEFGFVPENIANEFYASTFPTITSGKTTKIIMVSTPNGMNLFHKFWSEAKAGRNDFKPLVAHWSQVPGRDERWKQEMIRNIGGPEKFAQEMDLSFLSTSYTLIKPQILQTLTFEEPIASSATGYQEYVPPEEGHSYICCVDTASGQGLDYSAFVIIDTTALPYRVVATYANNRVTTMEYPAVIMEYARRYFLPWMLVEVNDIGRDIAHILYRDYEYPRLLTTMNDKRLGQRLGFGWSKTRHPGLRMTSGVKRSGCAIIKTLIENHQLLLHDHRIIQELSVFVQRGATCEAEFGHHDDLVMPLVMFGWASLQPNFAEVSNTRALDVYTQITKQSESTSAPIELHDETPMPIGVMGDFDDGWSTGDEDSSWLL